MKNLQSRFLAFVNLSLMTMRKKLHGFLTGSFFLQYIDNIIFILILALFAMSSFCETNVLGFVANVIFTLTVIKLLFVNGKKLKIDCIGLALFLYLVFAFISVINSTLLLSSFKGFLKTLTYLSFYFSLCVFLKDNYKKLPLILTLIAFVAFYESIYALFQGFIGVRQISTWQDVSFLNPEEVLTRAYGTLKPYNPNLLGGYLLVCLSCPLILSLLSLVKKHYKKAIIFALMFAAIIVSIIQTGCRGAYLGLFAFVFGLMIISFKLINIESLKQTLKKIYISLICFFTAVVFIYPPLQKRILSIFLLRTDSSTSFRLNVFKSSFEMFKDNFLFGIGQGNTTFREIYGLYMISGFDALSAYNIYLETAVETGIFGLISFLTFIYFCLKEGFKYIFDKLNNIKYIITVCGTILTLLAILTHGMFDTVFYRPQIQFIFWLNIAVLTTTVIYKRYGKCKEILNCN